MCFLFCFVLLFFFHAFMQVRKTLNYIHRCCFLSTLPIFLVVYFFCKTPLLIKDFYNSAQRYSWLQRYLLLVILRSSLILFYFYEAKKHSEQLSYHKIFYHKPCSHFYLKEKIIIKFFSSSDIHLQFCFGSYAIAIHRSVRKKRSNSAWFFDGITTVLRI